MEHLFNKEELLNVVEEVEKLEEELSRLEEVANTFDLSDEIKVRLDMKRYEFQKTKENATKAVLLMLKKEGKI